MLGAFSIIVQSLQNWRFTPLRLDFLYYQSPGIVAKYIERLPQDGPSHIRSLLKGIVATLDEAFLLDPENDNLVMKMQAIVANGSVFKSAASAQR